MAIELPGPVVSFLNVIGVGWPNVNEDKVREFASHIREFASSVDTTHQQATDTVKQLGAHYKGASYEALLTAWGEKSSTHMTELVSLCHAVATALDVAAGYIKAEKMACIGQLGVWAVAFAAEQAAAVETLGRRRLLRRRRGSWRRRRCRSWRISSRSTSSPTLSRPPWTPWSRRSAGPRAG